jgi:hypothetical protein
MANFRQRHMGLNRERTQFDQPLQRLRPIPRAPGLKRQEAQEIEAGGVVGVVGQRGAIEGFGLRGLTGLMAVEAGGDELVGRLERLGDNSEDSRLELKTRRASAPCPAGRQNLPTRLKTTPALRRPSV